jgi:hypothetical protein
MPDPEEDAGAWRRAEEAGAFVPFNRTVAVDGEQIEIVKSYADCSLTAVFWRNRPRSLSYPRALEPSELVAGASGGMIDDLYVIFLPPVLREREQIVITFDQRAAPWEATPIAIPVDRGRTGVHDRFLDGPAPTVSSAGVRVEIVAVSVGLVRTATELIIEGVDGDLLAMELDSTPFRPHVTAGPGPAALWRDWLPPVRDEQRTVVRREGSRVSASTSAHVTFAARQLTAEELAKLPPPREPPPAWRATAMPGGPPLAVQGSSGRGGPPPDHPLIQPILYFDAPPPEAQAIELSLDQLWAYRHAYATTTISPPRSDRAVSLAGRSLEADGCRVDFIQWDAAENEFTLHGRCTPPDVWPDIRVMADGASASLWFQPTDDGVIRAGLPLNHAALFDRPEVELAIRMIAKRVPPVTLSLPLTRPRSGR